MRTLPSVALLSMLCAWAVANFNVDQVPIGLIDDSALLGPGETYGLHGEDTEEARGQMVQRLLTYLQRSPNFKSDSESEFAPLGLSKRQVRYHQCYFNPVSCFRRKRQQ